MAMVVAEGDSSSMNERSLACRWFFHFLTEFLIFKKMLDFHGTVFHLLYFYFYVLGNKVSLKNTCYH